MVANSTSAALSALRNKPAPKFLRVKQSDSDDIAQVTVPDVTRWKLRITKILDGLPWEWLEPLDAKGNIVGPRVENTDLSKAATELEEFEEPETSGKMGGELAGLGGLLSMLLKAQDVALVRQSQAYAVVLDNNQALLKTITDRLSSMEKHAHQSFEVITALHNRLNMELHAGGDGDDGLDGIVKEVLAEVAKDKLGLGGKGGEAS